MALAGGEVRIVDGSSVTTESLLALLESAAQKIVSTCTS